MKLSAKITVATSVLVVAGLVALAAPAVATFGQAAHSAAEGVGSFAETLEPTAAATLELPATEPAAVVDTDPCAERAWINTGRMHASLSGDLVDMGARDLAAGTVGLDDEGRVKTYTVAPGDALLAIGDRFCIENPLAISGLNHTHMIAPGEVLLLAPDSSIPWVDYYIPPDAPGGFEQVPYQLALQAMSRAAHAGDVDAMRTIFADGLREMFPRLADADLIAQALDRGDLDVLRQMFA
ncbi:hypothetical protein HF576_07660 [Microbacterium sp. CFH 90308]|uniref:LysM domain-containing protein n=1 Tax=Microbacterium salsuginis TaxID=2722803 RepID=A0ABX1K9S8_9MICO|nr:hypothetical protein [Microbacterium sp. CFH 90308]NLP83719.1 hypothetical protein [Microbacterium sp. CFH 90308]